MNQDELSQKIARLQGPILVLGGGGFIGANLFHALFRRRQDVYAVVHGASWRLEGVPESNVLAADLLVDANLDKVLADAAPRTVFNCAAYGAYSFETDATLIHRTNFLLTSKLLERLSRAGISCYVHAGSSSEYGDRAAGPAETELPRPNSDYAVSKLACANLIQYYGNKKGLPCANLRLYSVYGPLEDSSRLIPTLVRCGDEKRYPELVDPEISRDFIYVDDACEAFVDAALSLRKEDYGASFNIGSGRKTTIRDAAAAAKSVFGLSGEPAFRSMAPRSWDMPDWYADPSRATARLGWRARTEFADGLAATARWYRGLADKERYLRSSKRYGLDKVYSVSAVIACYKDGQAIPIMYRRLKDVFEKLRIEHEIIFVNDNSPDDSEEAIRALTSSDRRALGVTHSRNFGSQSAFRSGMELASMNACVLLDGDLQDPPELIERFVEKWREGYEVVYGRRTRREGSLFLNWSARLFYRVFDAFSYVRIPHDAGDFSLLDKRVVEWILRCPERDLFLRGVRSFVGFKQAGVDYYRPKRRFGESTNNLFKNIGWAKKGILSFSNTPLNILSFCGTGLFLLALLLAGAQLASRLLFPSLAPRGITTVLLTVLFLGSFNLLGIAVIGEYVAKIFEEVKQRPHFIRRHIIASGEVRDASAPPRAEPSSAAR